MTSFKSFVKKGLKILKRLKTTYTLRNKIKKIVRSNPKLKEAKSRNYLNHINTYWKEEMGYKINPTWHFAYSSVNGKKDPKYIPEDLFYKEIVPRLNRLELKQAYSDKNSHKKFLTNLSEPKTVIRNMNSIYFDGDYHQLTISEVKEKLRQLDGEFVIKPSIASGGGKSVQIARINKEGIFIGGKKLSFTDLLNKYKSDFLIQEKIKQHKVLNKIYPHSLNTIRVITYKHEQTISILSVVARFGNNGSLIDNQSAGGISSGVNNKGFLNNFAVDKFGNILYEHPYTGIKFEGISIPNFIELKRLVKSLHNQLLYFNIVSWDIGINIDGELLLIEMNLGAQEINFHQFNNGPLFKELTKFVGRKK